MGAIVTGDPKAQDAIRSGVEDAIAGHLMPED
jgi:hypothetical protein